MTRTMNLDAVVVNWGQSGRLAGIAALAIAVFFAMPAAAIPPIPQIPDVPVIRSGERTYHLNNELGRDAPLGGSEAYPWRTLKYAAQRLEPGDTLVVHGTAMPYRMDWTSLTRSGQEGRWITVEGRDGNRGERVVFRGRLSLGDRPNVPVSYVRLRNVLFQGGGESGLNIRIQERSHHLVLDDVEIDCQGDPANDRGIWTDNHVRDVWFTNVSVHHCGYSRRTPQRRPVKWKPPTDCGGICVKGDSVDNIVFLNVRTADNVGDGIGGGSGRASGRAFFKGCLSERNTGDGFDPGGGILTVIVNSISRNNGGHQGAGFKFWSKESWLVGSVAYNNQDVGVFVKPQHGGENDAYILNSSLVLNSTGRYGGQLGTTAKLPESGRLSFYVYNNIFYSVNTSAVVINNVERQFIREEAHNYYFAAPDPGRRPGSGHEHAIHMRDSDMKVIRGYSFLDVNDGGRWRAESGQGEGNIGQIASARWTDPGFRSLTDGDLRLVAGSLAIDRGVRTGGGPVYDLHGTRVPTGGAPDMGAYEHAAR